jgi:proteasome lid subunit RPN8/RPN11
VPEPRNRFFLSYSRRDFYFSEQLAVALRRHGLAVWLDVHELPMGSHWSAAIDRAIAEYDAFVLVASREAKAAACSRRRGETGGRRSPAARGLAHHPRMRARAVVFLANGDATRP